MALFGTMALAVVVVLAPGESRLPLSAIIWRVLHAFVPVLVVVLGVGHAVLTDSALVHRARRCCSRWALTGP